MTGPDFGQKGPNYLQAPKAEQAGHVRAENAPSAGKAVSALIYEGRGACSGKTKKIFINSSI